jgi:hypothetical protein
MSGNSYDNPMRISKSFGLHDYGAGGLSSAIAVPAGASRCRIESIALSATETFNAVTTQAYVRLGTAGDADRYAELAVGVLAITNALDLTEGSTELKDIGHGGKGVVDIGQEGITQIEVVLVAPTGGTPAGIAYTDITIAWW